MALNEELAIRIYRDMIRSRALDEQLIKDARGGVMRTQWHSGLGQEAIVGPICLLNPEDYATYTHRGAYVWVAKGMDMKEILAEFYGKATGCAKGKGGTHITKPSLGIFGRAGSQGGHFVLAMGMGIAAKMKRKGQVVIMCFGDGCGTRGTLHESMNYASINKLPILWLCENNGYSMSVGVSKTWAVQDIAKIAPGYSMPGKTVDGNDVVAVTEAAQEFLGRARKGEGPSLLIAGGVISRDIRPVICPKKKWRPGRRRIRFRGLKAIWSTGRYCRIKILQRSERRRRRKYRRRSGLRKPVRIHLRGMVLPIYMPTLQPSVSSRKCAKAVISAVNFFVLRSDL
jgi:transketolase N-terminal domain/subunit